MKDLTNAGAYGLGVKSSPLGIDRLIQLSAGGTELINIALPVPLAVLLDSRRTEIYHWIERKIAGDAKVLRDMVLTPYLNNIPSADAVIIRVVAKVVR